MRNLRNLISYLEDRRDETLIDGDDEITGEFDSWIDELRALLAKLEK
jgi:FtsZ-binding cell division protein ZapB